ncbi:alpha/beta hydrolase fold domain-containing protein [Actinoplanes sp. URMC 104]|uniref:alpha/beta hydrolase fold domain-containing protein n=1 Tax=Actinoplanes sp. URMC 104 TaxID=3423409 RepID=UPI003F1A2287
MTAPAHEAPLPAAVAGADGVRVLHGVPYASQPGVRPLELDLYLPPGTSAPPPVVVFLHGGGWRVGSRHSAGPAFRAAVPSPFERVAASGVAVASIDYRLSGEAHWPAQRDDAEAAVRWLRTRAGELGVDGARIAAWGESAGGQLAAILGLTGDRIATVVAWYPPTDLVALPGDAGADPAAPDSREAQLLGAPVSAVPDLAADASPVSHVHAGAPPFLLLHGRHDRLIPCRQSERLRDALTRTGAPVTLETYDGADHMWLGAPDAAGWALDRTIDHLARHLS